MTSWGYGTSTTTTWVDATDTFWIDDDTFDTGYYTSDEIPVPREASSSEPSITYDPETKKFVVHTDILQQGREFNTKRSAKRFVKRWQNKKNGVTERKKSIYEQYKEKAIEKRTRNREREERLELMRIAQEQAEELQRQMAIQAEQVMELQELANEEDNYFERLGL